MKNKTGEEKAGIKVNIDKSGWWKNQEAPGDQWSSMAFHKKHKWSTVNGRIPKVPSLTLLRGKYELKSRFSEQPEKIGSFSKSI